MDFNKLKVFGFARAYTKYKIYDPTKFRYVEHPKYGYFEAPLRSNRREVKYLIDDYRNKLEYERFLNPKGLKYTITSNFPKIGDTHDYIDPKLFLVRSGKQQPKNSIKFKVDESISKPEIKQIVEKLYKFKVEKVRTAIMPGRVKIDVTSNKSRKYERTNDYKKALIEFDFEVDKEYRKLDLTNK
jgi:ribosomal protein L23